jgi:hypothetical protein
MAFKDLLLLIGEGTEAGNRYGLWLANICGAKLTAVSPPVKRPPTFFAPEMPGDILDHIREEAEREPVTRCMLSRSARRRWRSQ